MSCTTREDATSTSLQAMAALIQDAPRIAGPRRRSGALGGHETRRSLRRAVARHRPHGQQPVDDRRHLRAVGRPHGAVVFPHADRLVRHRIEPAIRLAVERDSQHLIRALAEARRVDLERRDDQRAAVGRPAGAPGLVQALVRFRDRAALHVDDLDLPVRIAERDPRAVRRPRRLHCCGRAVRQLTIGAAPDVAHPEVHRAAACPIQSRGGPTIRERRAVRRPRRIGLDPRVAGQPLRRARQRHHPQIADRRERDLRPVRRHDRMHDAAHRLRPERSNVRPLRRERRTRERHVRRELDHAGGATGGRPPFDLAVGGVEHLVLRHPLGAERKDVLVRSAIFATADHQPAAAAGDHVERHRRTVRSERGPGDGPLGGRHQPLGRIRSGRSGIDRIHAGRLAAIGHECDLVRSGSPRRMEFVGRIRGQLRDAAGRQRHHPDVVAAAAIATRRRCADRQATTTARDRRTVLTSRPSGRCHRL